MVSPKEAFLILKYLNMMVKNDVVNYNITVNMVFRIMGFHGSQYHAHKCENIAVPRQVFPSCLDISGKNGARFFFGNAFTPKTSLTQYFRNLLLLNRNEAAYAERIYEKLKKK
jgi:hypothetical protein